MGDSWMTLGEEEKDESQEAEEEQEEELCSGSEEMAMPPTVPEETSQWM